MTASGFAELPEIQESEIEELCTTANFKKGRVLFDDEKLGELRVEGDLISAICTEKSDDVAVPQAQFNTAGVINTACTCSHSGGGICRHRVALLLYLAHTPEKFERLDVLPETEPEEAIQQVVAPTRKKAEAALFEDLSKRDSEELASMILALVESEPKLKGALRRLMQSRLSEGEIKKVRTAIESQVKKILKMHDPNFSLVRREIKLQLRSAHSLEVARPIDAGRLFVAILEGLLSGRVELFNQDPASIFSNAVEECLAAIHRVFASATSDRRLQWLETVCSVFLMKIELAGFDFAEGCEEILLQATPEEWQIIEKRLDLFLESRKGLKRRATVWNFAGAEEISYYDGSKWERETIVGLKTDWMARHGKAAEAREIVMEQGSPGQQVKVLLREKNFAKATEIAGEKFKGLSSFIVRFADDLLHAGEWERAKAWAIEHEMFDWLADKSVERGESDALEHLINFFGQQSDFTAWNRVMDYAKPAEREVAKRQMWGMLEERGAYLAQFDIAIALGQVDSAVELWPKLNSIQQESRQIRFAAAIEEKHPLAALQVWNDVVKRAIDVHRRESYREAAHALTRVKKLMEDSGRGPKFAVQLANLKLRYSMLRALLEELARVGL